MLHEFYKVPLYITILTQHLVTGASGFLGVEVAIAVLESGADVVATDIRPSPPPTEWSK
jgi:nucleoside-diphosphate-sugar epimerase